MSSSTSTATISTNQPPLLPISDPQLILSLHPIILQLLISSSPILSATTAFLDLITWQNRYHSFLCLFSWWFITLYYPIILLLGPNSFILVYIFYSRYKRNTATTAAASSTTALSATATAITPSQFNQIIKHGQIISNHFNRFKSLVASLTTTATTAAATTTTIIVSITSYPVYLLLLYYIPFNIILLFLGTIIILWNAPFVTTSRRLLWKSAAMRWIGRIMLAIFSVDRKALKKEFHRRQTGLGVAGWFKSKPNVSVETKVKVKSLEQGQDGTEEDEESVNVELQLTVFENQRWWVGLDWTHALLPGERASWTDPALNPSSPPSSFILPPPTITYTPSPTKSDPNSRLKVITEWKWLDSEWIVVQSSAQIQPSPPTGPIIPLPLLTSSRSRSTSTTSDPVGFAAGSISSSNNSTSSFPAADPTLFTNWSVDAQGWQYGDNLFEKMTAKGGLGKYTRRRAWVRRAGLVERGERVAGSSSTSSTSTTSKLLSSTLSREGDKAEREKRNGGGSSKSKDRDASVKRRKSTTTTTTPAKGE